MEENNGRKDKQLVVKLKELCGKKYYYPENEAARTALAITKTTAGRRVALTETDIENLEKLGMEIQILKPKVTYE